MGDPYSEAKENLKTLFAHQRIFKNNNHGIIMECTEVISVFLYGKGIEKVWTY